MPTDGCGRFVDFDFPSWPGSDDGLRSSTLSVRQMRSLIAAFALLVSLGSAQANLVRTFDVVGTYSFPSYGTLSGTITLDVTAGTFKAVHIVVQGFPDFIRVGGSGRVPGAARWSISAWDASHRNEFIMDFSTPQVLSSNPGSLVGFNGGTILGAQVQTPCGPNCAQNAANGFVGTITSRFGGSMPAQPFRWCLPVTAFLPYCGRGVPICTKPIPCSFFGQPASTCAEWKCLPPNFRSLPRRPPPKD
jgi:hypothetical protein